MESHKKYNLLLLGGILIALCSVGGFNYRVAPTAIFEPSGGAGGGSRVDEYVQRLIRSKIGLRFVYSIWEERDVKAELARQTAGVECAVIGSSHMMQVSSFRPRKSLRNLCSSIVNLSLSGGSLEDALALSWYLLENPDSPDRIVFGMSPWSLDVNRDDRWGRYRSAFLQMSEALNLSLEYHESEWEYNWARVRNLINPQYTWSAIRKLQRVMNERSPQSGGGREGSWEIEAVNYDDGNPDPVLLPDGSLVYEEQYIDPNAWKAVPAGGFPYKIREGEKQFSQEGIGIFSSLVRKLQSRGKQVTLLMAPYQHNAWIEKDAPVPAALHETEIRIRQLAEHLNLTAIGSFDPRITGCRPQDFFDHMHAKAACLGRISR